MFQPFMYAYLVHWDDISLPLSQIESKKKKKKLLMFCLDNKGLSILQYLLRIFQKNNNKISRKACITLFADFMLFNPKLNKNYLLLLLLLLSSNKKNCVKFALTISYYFKYYILIFFFVLITQNYLHNAALNQLKFVWEAKIINLAKIRIRIFIREQLNFH